MSDFLDSIHTEFERLCSEGFPLSDLDPICAALDQYQKQHSEKGGRIHPNRIVALAAVRLMEEWERDEWAKP